MKFLDLIIILIISSIIVLKPNVMILLLNSFLGKCLILFFIIFTSKYSNFIPVALAILYIYVSEDLQEHMSTKSNLRGKTKQIYENYHAIYNIRNKHCKNIKGKNVFVDSKGKRMNLQEVKDLYPNINFDSKNCVSPCDPKCDFTLSS